MLEAPLIERRTRSGVSRSEVSEYGKAARTEVLDAVRLTDSNGEAFTLLKIWLHTGRTHQIRVHMSHEGFPLVGDPAYGGPVHGWCQRQWLHSSRLVINELDIKVPLPQDLRRALNRLTPEDDEAASRLKEWQLDDLHSEFTHGY